jgi:prepilin-type N-terminal cleavage/methylation domain-containing protein
MKRQLLQGFTLMEILVVISIIGILVTILTANFMEARVDSRNKALMAEFKEVQLALELYKAQHGHYPPPACEHVTNSNWKEAKLNHSSCSAFQNSYITGLVPEFIGALPQNADSPSENCRIFYRTENSNTPSWYKFYARRCVGGIEDISEGIAADAELALCPTSCQTDSDTRKRCDVNSYDTYITGPTFYESIAVYSPGGQCW